MGFYIVRLLPVMVTAAGSIAALAVRPRVKLAHDTINIALPPADLILVLRERFADSPDDILAIEPHRIVRRFAGTEGRFTFRTVESVRFEASAIVFEHLAGPFSECNERFDLTATPSGTLLAHSGSFRLRGGLWTALLAIGPVKKSFETHVRGHFQNMANEFGTY